MTRDEFWNIIETSRALASQGPREGVMSRQLTQLREQSLRLTPTELVEFQNHFRGLVDSANRWDLWAVAYIIAGGCSDDWFEYFRYWLVSLGHAAYERARSEPESVDAILRESSAEDIFFEEIAYVAPTEYRRRTGKEIPFPLGNSTEPAGEAWSSDQELTQRFPQLWAKYC